MSSDSSPQPHAAPGQALDDAPVGSAASKRPPRAHEWTRARMDAFLRELGATLSVSRAARAVGMGRQSAYKLKKRLAGQPFAAAWDEALADARLTCPPPPFAAPVRCPLCGGQPRRPLGWGGA